MSNKYTYLSVMPIHKITQSNLLPEVIIPSTSFHISRIFLLGLLHVSMAKIRPFAYYRAQTPSIISCCPRKMQTMQENHQAINHLDLYLGMIPRTSRRSTHNWQIQSTCMTTNHSSPSTWTPLTKILANFLSPIEAGILVQIQMSLIKRHRTNRDIQKWEIIYWRKHQFYSNLFAFPTNVRR